MARPDSSSRSSATTRSGLPRHRPRPLGAAGQLPRARTEPAAEKADAAGPARRRPANEARLDRVRDVRRLDRLGSSGTHRLRSDSHQNRRNARPQDLRPPKPGNNCESRRFTATARTATSPPSPSSTRWTRACSPSPAGTRHDQRQGPGRRSSATKARPPSRPSSFPTSRRRTGRLEEPELRR